MFSFKNKHWRFVLPLLMALYCFTEVSGKGDFYIFLSAADDLGKHVNIFEAKYVDGYHYFYSVFFALLLQPFVSWPFFTIKYFWLLLNALLFLDLFRLLYRSELMKLLSEMQRDWFVFLLFIASFRFFTSNIHTSQITILIIWTCIRGLYFIFNGKIFPGALILALGINIKLLPIVFIPYLIWRKEFKAAALTTLFYFTLLFLPSIIVGNAYNMQLLSTWLSLINPLQQQHVLDVEERSFHGLSTLLSTLLVEKVPDIYALPLKRNIANLSLASLSKIIMIVRLTLIAFTVYFLRLKIFISAKNLLQQSFEISYILLLIPLIFPHQQHYAFLFAMPAFGACLYFLIRDQNKHPALIILLILIYLAFNLSLLLGFGSDYYSHFKIITWAALLLIAVLAITYQKIMKGNYSSEGSKVTLP